MIFDYILSNSYFLSRPFNKKVLTIDDLVRYKLSPKHHISIGGRSIYLSDKFQIASNEVPRLIAYIAGDDGKYLVSSFFLSKSQGLYRLLRAYKYRIDEEGNEQPSWNDKGYSEESIMLPFELQYFISTQNKDIIKIADKMEGIQIFYGTALESGTDTMYSKLIIEDPLKISGDIYTADKTKIKTAPETIYIEQNEKPDFNNLVLTWESESDIYGKITSRVFKSMNGKYSYLFLTDALKRAWIGGIDNDSEVTILGIRKRWVSMGSLGTPAYEYQVEPIDENGKYKIDETGGYGNRDLIYDDKYVDMYQNYLSLIPLIQEFEATQ